MTFSEERLGTLLEELYHHEDLCKNIIRYTIVKINLILDEIEEELDKTEGELDE